LMLWVRARGYISGPDQGLLLAQVYRLIRADERMG
jgi:hypothetical protein